MAFSCLLAFYMRRPGGLAQTTRRPGGGSPPTTGTRRSASGRSSCALGLCGSTIQPSTVQRPSATRSLPPQQQPSSPSARHSLPPLVCLGCFNSGHQLCYRPRTGVAPCSARIGSALQHIWDRRRPFGAPLTGAPVFAAWAGQVLPEHWFGTVNYSSPSTPSANVDCPPT